MGTGKGISPNLSTLEQRKDKRTLELQAWVQKARNGALGSSLAAQGALDKGIIESYTYNPIKIVLNFP
jgi:hypothetical protein